MNRSKRGSTLIIVFCAGMALAGLIAFGSRFVKATSKNTLIFNANNNALRAAESAGNTAMGVLTTNPLAYLEPGFGSEVEEDGTISSVRVVRRDFENVSNGYYMIASATKTIGSEPFNITVHTYFQMSNIGDYFAALKEDLIISQGIDISLGKVYAKQLFFELDGDLTTTTKIKQADYVYDCNPKTPWLAATKTEVVISEPASKEPVKLPYPRLFPQVLDSDLAFYREKAHINTSDLSVGHHKCQFSGDIFPPGYSGLKDGLDSYPRHTATNKDHVYYCTGTMALQGTVYGQVLFVAEKDIFLTDSLMSKDLTTTALNNSTNLPGNGADLIVNKGSSTAHQAILITPGSVIIDTTSICSQHGFVPGNPAITIKFEGLFLAPNGTIEPLGAIIDASVSNYLKLEFTGSMILSNNPSFKIVFNAGTPARVYKYLTTLGTFPPPDLPYITDIFYQFER